MAEIRDQLINMFSKIMAGTVTREEGTMLLNDLVKDERETTLKELFSLIDTPPTGVYPQTILHTIALSRNKDFYPIMTDCLEHKNEEVSMLAARELGRLKTDEAKQVLIEHLDSDIYHVRKVSAEILSSIFSDGVALVEKHLLSHAETFFRSTSAEALTKAGPEGMEALLRVLNSGRPGAMATAAEAVAPFASELAREDARKIVEALMKAGDQDNAPLITEMLKIVASLKERAQGFEDYVLAFKDYPSDVVRGEVENTLKEIRRR